MAEETEIKKVKRIVFTDEFVDEGSPFVVEYENGSIEVFSMKWEATLTLRELAEEADIPFEYDWSLEKLTKAIKKEVGEDTIGITVGNICVYLASANGRAICGIKEEGTTKEALRDLADRNRIKYEESWNTQQLRRNLISALIEEQEEYDGKKIEPEERVVIPTNTGRKSLAENESLQNYINGLLSALEKIKKDQQYTLRELFYIKSLANRATEESLELFNRASFDFEDTPEDLRLEIIDALYVDSFEDVENCWARVDETIYLDTYNFHIEYNGLTIKAYKLEDGDF